MKKAILVPALLGVMGIGGIIAVAGGNIVGSADTSKVLTKSEVEKKALAEVEGRITEIELDIEGLISVYEVEVVTADAEYDLKFNALSGELLKKTKDDHYYNDKKSNSNTTTNTNTITSTNTSKNSNIANQALPVTNQQTQDDDNDDWYEDDRYEDDDLDDLEDRYDVDFEDDDDDDDRYDD